MSQIESFDIFKSKNNFEKYRHISSELIIGDMSKNIKPVFSIIIPTYRRTDLLKYAIDSALNQKKAEKFSFEIIVVDNDNNTNSETSNLLKSYNNKHLLYYINKKNLGMFGNINRGAELARGKWLVYLHDDDMLVDDYFIKVSKILQHKKHLDALAISYHIINHNSNDTNNIENKQKKFIKSKLAQKTYRPTLTQTIITNANIFNAPTCGFLVDKNKFIKTGGFDEMYFPDADWFFFLNFAKKFNLYKTNQQLGYYRWLDNESLKISTNIDFLKHKIQLRKYLTEKSNIAKLVSYFWGNEIDFLAIKKMRNKIKNEQDMNIFDNEITTPEYSYYKLKIYRFIKKTYRKFIKIKLLFSRC